MTDRSLPSRDSEPIRGQKLSRVLAALAAGASYEQIDEITFQKRLAWYASSREKILLTGSDVRKAFDLFFRYYANVPAHSVEVTSESDTEIIWRAFNWCPYLEACKHLGLDTRIFCKNAHESCMDRFVKLVNPELTFSRSYVRIRPYAAFCEERIVLRRQCRP